MRTHPTDVMKKVAGNFFIQLANIAFGYFK